MRRSSWRRLWAATVAAVLLVPLIGTLPAGAQAEGLKVDGTTTYRVDPGAGRIRVRVEATLTNTEPSVRRGNYIQTPYFDRFAIPALGPVQRVRAHSSSGGRLSVDVEQERDGFSVLLVDLSPNLVHGAPQWITVEFDLPGQRPRSRFVTRVNKGFAAWLMLGTGDPGDIDMVVDAPESFELSLTTQPSVDVTVRNGRRIHRLRNIPTLEEAAIPASVSDESRLRTQRVAVPDAEVTVKAWPGDRKWGRFAARSVEQGLPVLQELVGQKIPDPELSVVESVRSYQLGYAGFYDPIRRVVDVGDELDELVMLHELSHIWFNFRLFADRWVSEGLAEEMANRAMDELGHTARRPRPIDQFAPGAVKLNAWHPIGAMDASRARVERFAYNASYSVIHELAEEIGIDGLREIIAAATQRHIPYAGDPPRETFHTVGDWRYFYDLAELVGGSEEIRDLFVRHVVTAEDRLLIQERSLATGKLNDLTEAGAGWTPPFEVRERMAEWRFEEATNAIAKAQELLERAQAVVADMESLGASSKAVEDGYESANPLDDFAATLDGYEEVTADAVAVQQRWDGANPLATLGLVGARGQLTRAASALGDGDVEGAGSAIDAASAAVDNATLRGVSIVGFVLLVAAGAAVAVRRRPWSRRHRDAPLP